MRAFCDTRGGFHMEKLQSSSLSLTTLQFSFLNILQTESSSWLWWTDEGIPAISMHSLREYWVMAQHCLSIFRSLYDKTMVIFFKTANSDSSFAKLKVSFLTSATRFSVCSSCLSCLTPCSWIMAINSF